MPSDLLNNLNTEQLKAVTHQGGPLLIVAGAGTGKTTVITRHIAYLIEQKLATPDQILALTFTEKAAGEMEARADQLLPLGYYDLWISTFHGFCQRILEQHGIDIGISGGFRILSEVQQWILVYKNFDNFKLKYYRPLGSPNKFIEALLSHFSKCKDEMISPEQYLEYAQKLRLDSDSPDLTQDGGEAERIEEVSGAFHAYQKLLLDNEYLDFGDLINYTIELFKRRPNILKYYQNKFKHILVDEFQDTNFAQYQLIKMLAGNPDEMRNSQGTGTNPQERSDEDKGHDPANFTHLVAVGDDDQSIYKFRGASVSNILKFKEEFTGVEEITLVQNYRNAQNILDLAYNFIRANDPNRLEIKLGINKKLKANIKTKGTIEVLEGRDLSDELDLVVKKIIELKQKHADSGWNDFAILIRANSAANEILPRLDAQGIPYTFLANSGLFKKRIIFDLINYLRLLDNYHESSSLFRLLNYEKFSLEPNDLSLLSNFAHRKTLSLYEALGQARTIPGLSPDSIAKIEALVGLMKTHAEMAKQRTAVEVFVTIIDDLGLRAALEADTLENAENREYLEQFYKKIEEFEQQNDDKTLRGFIGNLQLEIEAGSEGLIKFDPNLGPESLKIITVHSAKGLEYKFVFIVNLVDQRFPTRAHRSGIEIPEPLIKDILPEGDFHLQEERRLFYVALTRAKTHLYLSWGRDYGGAKLKKPSLFLQETKLVPSEKVVTATGKVVFNRPAKNNKKAVYKNLPDSFSYSEIMAFKNCPLDYKYRFYLRLPMPGAPALSFGKTIHKVLQNFGLAYRAGRQNNQLALFGQPSALTETEFKVPEFKLMEDLYREHWIDEWFHSKKEKEDYRKLGLEILKTAYADFKDQRPDIKYIEHLFKVPLGKYAFEGKIDRIDSTDGGVTIIDYKTNAAPKIKAGKDIDQLDIYQWAAETFLHEKVQRLEYWHLKDNQRVQRVLYTPEQQEQMKKELLEIIEDILHTIKFDLFAERHAQTRQHTCNFAGYL